MTGDYVKFRRFLLNVKLQLYSRGSNQHLVKYSMEINL